MTPFGHIVPLKTIYELEVKESLAEACVVEIPIKLANRALSILRPVLPAPIETPNSFHYLRRLVTTPHLPSGLRDDVQVPDGVTTIHLLLPPPLPLVIDDIVTALIPHAESDHLPIARTTQIPLEPPTTAEQAALWSKDYWPCTFNPASQTIQKAPPLQTLRTIKAELNKSINLEAYFRLAHTAATESDDGSLGRKVAAVVVDPSMEEVIAVAGDGRWCGQTESWLNGKHNRDQLPEGRPEHHALMRAIAMVAAKEKQRRGTQNSPTQPAELPSTDICGQAITSIEKFYTATNAHTAISRAQSPGMPPAQSVERSDAYLCSGLDVYLTHEPCIACSMAMIHSRIRACIFAQKMPATGGLCAEMDDGGVGHGLFWRKELNWRVMTFRYIASNESVVNGKEGRGDGIDGDDGDMDANFHA